MAFPFSNWFKSKQGAPSPDSPAENAPTPEAPPPAPQPQAVKTVLPKAVKPNEAMRPPITLPTVMPGSTGPGGNRLPPPPPGTRKISFPGKTSEAPAAPDPVLTMPAPRRPTPAAPPSAAPNIKVVLQLGDFIDRIPINFLQPGEFDRKQTVEFMASELYSDLSRGRATVPASTIYQKCPQIFARPVSETEDVEVYLPLNKLVEQMGAALQPRADQVSEESVAEIETPFLQVAREDNARLPQAPGTAMGATIRAAGGPPLPSAAPRSPLPAIPAPAADAQALQRSQHRTGQISPISPIKPPAEASNQPLPAPSAPPTGPILSAKRPPSTVRASVAGSKIRLSGPAVSSRSFQPGATPPVPPTGQPPEGANAASTQGIPPRLGPVSPNPPTASPSHQVTKKTARIQIPPISLRPAGASPGPRPAAPAPPAAPTVQPSPVPIRPGPEALTSFKSVPPSASPAPAPSSVTFRSTPPPPPAVKPAPPSFSPLRPSFPPPAFPAAPPPPPAPGLTATSAAPAPAPELEADSPASIASDQLIDLGLAAVLRSMPAPALEISPSAVYEDVRISLPFHLIEPQLSHGRVTVPLNVFTEALPEAYRNVLAADSGLTEVPIPLQEVFRNLPANALSMREDQVVEETGPMFPTPFSQKAEEDAQRFSPPPTPAPVPVVSLKPAAVEPPPAPEPPPVVEEPIEEPVADRTAPVAPSQEEEPAAPESQPPVVAEEPPAPVHEPEPLSEIPTPDHDESITNQPDADSPVETPAEEPAAASAGIELPPLPAQEPEEAPQAELAPAPSFVEEPVIEPPQDHQISAQPEPEPAAASEALAPTEPSDLSAPPSVIELPQLSVPAEDTTSQKEAEAPAVSESAEIAESARIVEESFAPDVEAKKEEIAAPSPEPVESPAPVPPILRDLPEASAPVAVREKDTELQVLFMTEDELDAKTIVRLVGQLPGIESCAVMFSDGLLLAGNAGQGADNEGFSAMAPPFYQRSINFTKELALGQLQALTLYTDQGLLSFFMHENICLSVQHAGRGFLPGVREKLSVVTRELAKMYSSDKPAASEQLSQD